MRGRLLDGAVAGAVGSVALDVVSYLDMVVRARPASSTPQASAGRLAGLADVDLGPEDQADNRRSGLGPLLGYGLGIAAGAAFAVLAGHRRLPTPLAVALLGGGVMAASDGSMTVLGVTDPRTWRRTDWVADLVPHLAYGMAAAATWNRLRPPR
ncbi:hypothetical protein K7640_24385 [Micromonospora sp. PLK6-60]|uniref:hypothetical protein n=1 Tax=Micromonospora sp. PLK6-60 TaxID=2873383 RepID=UPI001CA74B1B|nr:hypothetical protein [Micromonospora sp. PLK6-60]MBY8874971.1 hypothetical protein [Micromonospora sp. PLK6-60]